MFKTTVSALNKGIPFVSRCFYACWTPLFAVLCVLSLRHVHHRVFCLAAAAVLALGIFWLLWRVRDRIDRADRACTVCACILFAVFFAGLLTVGKLMTIYPTSDSGTVWYSVADIVDSGSVSQEVDEYTSCFWFTKTSNHNYFLIYPNTRFMVSYLLPFCRAVHNWLGVNLRSDRGYFCGAVFNAVSITASVVFAFLAARKEKGNTAALFLLVFSVLFLPFYLNVYRVYSDTLSMPWLALALLLTVLADHETRGARRCVIRFATGLSLAVGILLKGNLWIFAVALLIYLVLRFKWTGKTLAEAAVLTLGILLVTQAWSVRADRLPWLDTTDADRYELPAMHWVFMASEGDGAFNQQKTEYMLGLSSVEERNEAAKREYRKQLEEYGAWGFIRFTLSKLSFPLSDGSFSQQIYLDRQTGLPLEAFVTTSGQHFALFRIVVSTGLYLLYMAIGLSAILGITEKEPDFSALLHISMFGLILFFSFWEVKSRYFLNFTPLLIVNAVFAYDKILSFLKQRQALKPKA